MLIESAQIDNVLIMGERYNVDRVRIEDAQTDRVRIESARIDKVLIMGER